MSSFYDTTVLADGPLSFWKCGESAGSTLADSGTGANPLAIPSGQGIVLGQAGIGDGETAVQFSGSSTSAACSATPGQTLSGPWSFEIWVNLASTSGGPIIFSTRSPSDLSYDLQDSGASNFHADIGSGAGWLSTAADTSGFTIATGTWYHVVYAITATGYTIYVNGVSRGSGSWASATPLLWDSNHHIFLGASPANNNMLMTVAKAAAYNFALSAAQVLAHYSAQFPPPPTPPPRSFYDRPRLHVLVADRDVTERCDSIVFSATDTGGYEIATLGLPSADRPKKGTQITIRQGLEVAWMGRVAEISDHSQHGRATKTTGCEGLVALLKDNPFSMIYVDRDLTQWGSPSNQRQINSVAINRSFGSSQTSPDTTSGFPAVVQEIDDSWVSPYVPVCEAWYDAGSLNLIAQIYYSVIASGPALATTDQVFLSVDDVASTFEASGNLYSAGGASGYFAPGTPYRYGLAQKEYFTTPGGAQGARYLTSWRNLAVYGTHGLPGRGADPVGFYPSDVARHALAQCAGILPGTIVDSIGYIAPHVAYKTPTTPAQIIDDMAKLMGWPWGVWDSGNVLGAQPRLDFRPPPPDATAIVTKAECDQIDITSRLGDLYSTAQITYTDPAGIVGVVTVTAPNPQLVEAGIPGRTLVLNMGAGSAPAAQVFGGFALALSQISARAAGQATLPVSVRLPGGGSKPAHLLRPGIDKLRIVDLIDGGSMFDLGASRRDVFRISRVETTVGRDGTPSTRAELDSGTNLLETLQARLALADGVVGSGASGG